MKLIANFVSLAAGEFIAKGLTFVSFAYLARTAGPEGFGWIEFAGASVLCAGLVVEQGFNTLGAREIARDPRRMDRLVSEIILVRLILALAAYITLVIAALAFSPAILLTRLILVYGLSLLAMPMLLQWVFQGHDQMRVVAAIQIGRQLIFAILVFTLVRDLTSIWLVGVAETVATLTAATIGMTLYRRRFAGHVQFRWPVRPQLVRDGAVIGLSQIFWVVKMSGSTLLLGLIARPEDIGFFGAAMRILMAVHTFVWLYYFNLLPTLVRARNTDSTSFGELVSSSLRYIAWIAALGVGLWIVMAPKITEMIYGTAFAAASLPLQIFAFVCGVAAISGHYRFGLIAASEQTAEMLTSLGGAIISVIVVPIGYVLGGVVAAAIGLCVAEVAIWLSAWGFGRSRLGLRDHSQFLIRPALAALSIAICLAWLPASSTLIRLATVVSTFIILALALDPAVRNVVRTYISGSNVDQPRAALSKASR